jgi:hypothetical protein
LYWCSVLSIIFVRCSVSRTELLWESNSQCDFYGDVTLPLTVQSRCYCGNVHGVSVHISVRFLCQNRKSFCHCRTQLRRCKSFKPCWFVAYVKKNVLLLQAFRRHDQDSWCRIVLTQLVTVALLVLHFSYMRHVCS